jgi:hypothetical protein
MSEKDFEILQGEDARAVAGFYIPDDVRLFRAQYKGSGPKGKMFWAICPEGHRYIGTNVRRFCARVEGLKEKSHNSTMNQVERIFRGEQRTVHGWQFGVDVERFAQIQGENEKEELRDLIVAEREDRKSMTPDEVKSMIRRRFFVLNENQEKYETGKAIPPKGFDIKKATDFLKDLAEVSGIEWRHVSDTRSDSEKAQDAVERLLAAPESMFEIQTRDLEALERSMTDAVERTETYLAEIMGKSPVDAIIREEIERGKQRAVNLSRWVDRVRRVIRMRNMGSKEIPEEMKTADKVRIWALRASYSLRFQIYVGRSDISDSSGSPAVFQVGYPHAKMATDVWLAENKIKVMRDRLLFPGDKVPGYEEYKAFGGVPYAGALVMYPPRHGKTAFECHWAALRINRNNRTQGGYIHARREEAQKFVKYVSSLFSTGNSAGRRNLSLFPATLSKRDNNAHSIRLETDDPPSNPNLIGDSVMGSAQGNNLDWLIVDDIVSSKDQESPTDRERTKRRVKQTWMTRFQGNNGFYIVSGYPWHHSDAIWEFKMDAERAIATNNREGVSLMISMMPVGGPKTKFFSIWPEMYSAKKLRSMYQNNIRDASVWAANYELNPMTDELRIVKRLRLYDPAPKHDPQQHERFVRTSEVHISVDPAFTNTATSDYAGIVKVAFGTLMDTVVGDDDRTYTHAREVIRVLDVQETKATQTELAALVASQSMLGKIDYCHVETNTGGGAVVQMLESLHGISGSAVIEHKTGPRSKEIRLKRVAPMLEDGSDGLDAVVEFPGVWEMHNGDMRMVIDPKMRDIYNYIVNFKMSTGFHSLDAMTQLLGYLAPMVGFGEGKVSDQARSFAQTNRGLIGDDIARRMKEAQDKSRPDDQIGFDEAQWMSGEFGV